MTVGIAPEITQAKPKYGSYPSLYNSGSTGYLSQSTYLLAGHFHKDFFNSIPPPASAENMLKDNDAPSGLVHKLDSPNMILGQTLDPLLSRSSLQWDWDIEHEDRKLEAKADALIRAAPPFQVDRKLLKDIVHEKAGAEVARIKFLGAGTFHKGYLVTLVDGREVVARVARRFMPHLKTESEVATMRYLRERTNIPVPTVYHYDSNPYNRLGGEFIIMSKAVGIPLSHVFHSMSHNQLMAFMENLAMLVVPLFAHRFPKIGSLYSGPDPDPVSESTDTAPTPTAPHVMSHTLSMTPVPLHSKKVKSKFHVGPIISWPFFGSNRGELQHPDEMNRGPWRSTHSYLMSCVEREITGVMLENEGKAAPHRLHLDPDEIHTSRHHHIEALPGDESDTSDEYDWEESEEEWEGPGDTMYRDYRRMQRSTFLVAHLKEREQKVKEEMARFVRLVERLGAIIHKEAGDGDAAEEFALDCHDLSLENVFVDEHDIAKITCVIDWESTTTRPLWAAAHVPVVLQTSPFTAKLFRATVEKFAKRPTKIIVNGESKDLAAVALEWLHYEAWGVRLRMAHRCVEWDGWEEGLVDSILGPEDHEDEWFKSWDRNDIGDGSDTAADADSLQTPISPTLTGSESGSEGSEKRTQAKPQGRQAVPMVAKVAAAEKEKEKLLNATGDYCGGRGGELGRRLEAWLTVNGDAEGRVELGRKWKAHDEAKAS
ncbi:unnamed protein product [Somion occarium]|uniref:Aminoglycoside phosphotransferase domain-containing protein n=1 Tax=Somion occarium TaxID=3059160 RepID=A0ABP1DQR4_9APHY